MRDETDAIYIKQRLGKILTALGGDPDYFNKEKGSLQDLLGMQFESQEHLIEVIQDLTVAVRELTSATLANTKSTDSNTKSTDLNTSSTNRNSIIFDNMYKYFKNEQTGEAMSPPQLKSDLYQNQPQQL